MSIEAITQVATALGKPFPVRDTQSLIDIYMAAPRAVTEAMHTLGYAVPIEVLMECAAKGRVEHFEAILRGASLEPDIVMQLLKCAVDHDQVHFLVYMSRRMNIMPFCDCIVQWVNARGDDVPEMQDFLRAVRWITTPRNYSDYFVSKLARIDAHLRKHPRDETPLTIDDYRLKHLWNQILSEGSSKDMNTIFEMVIYYGLFSDFVPHTLQSIRHQEIILSDTAVRFLVQNKFFARGSTEPLEALLVYGNPQFVQMYLRMRETEMFDQRDVDEMYVRIPVGRIVNDHDGQHGEDMVGVLRALYDACVVPSVANKHTLRRILHAWIQSVIYGHAVNMERAVLVFQQFHCFYILPKYGNTWRPEVLLPEIVKMTMLGQWLTGQGYHVITLEIGPQKIDEFEYALELMPSSSTSTSGSVY